MAQQSTAYTSERKYVPPALRNRGSRSKWQETPEYDRAVPKWKGRPPVNDRGRSWRDTPSRFSDRRRGPSFEAGGHEKRDLKSRDNGREFGSKRPVERSNWSRRAQKVSEIDASSAMQALVIEKKVESWIPDTLARGNGRMMVTGIMDKSGTTFQHFLPIEDGGGYSEESVMDYQIDADIQFNIENGDYPIGRGRKPQWSATNNLVFYVAAAENGVPTIMITPPSILLERLTEERFLRRNMTTAEMLIFAEVGATLTKTDSGIIYDFSNIDTSKARGTIAAARYLEKGGNFRNFWLARRAIMPTRMETSIALLTAVDGLSDGESLTLADVLDGLAH
jgi:hypothetical protein